GCSGCRWRRRRSVGGSRRRRPKPKRRRSPPRPTRRCPPVSNVPVWGARLGALDPRAAALNDSLAVDRRLWPEELALTRAYAPTLVECGVMTAAEADSLVVAAGALEDDLLAGATTLAGEDVHSA